MLEVIKTITIEVMTPRGRDPGEIEAIESRAQLSVILYPVKNTRRSFPTQGVNQCLLHCRWILYH